MDSLICEISLALLLISAIREILGAGTFLGYPIATNFRPAAVMILVVAEGLLAAVAVVLSDYPASVLYVPLQAAVFYLVLAMALSVLFKSEVTAALVSIPFLFFGLVSSGTRLSPAYNTLAPNLVANLDAGVILARTIQNRIGYVLIIAALVALAFARAERREKMMS